MSMERFTMKNLRKSMNKTLVIFAFLQLSFYAKAYEPFKEATAPQCNIASPNATAIARYGDLPMDYYTGRAKVTVPIYHTSQRGVILDVNLTYDTQGIIATSLPGWTGHNWTLNAGGVITRVKNLAVDEFQYSIYNRNWRNYFAAPNKLKEYVNRYNADNRKEQQRLTTLVDSIIVGDYDCNPDVFYFNFMGKSGRFFYGDDGQWKVLSEDNICVVFDVDDSNNYILPYFKYHNYSFKGKQRKTIKGFTLIDEDGTKYIFGDNSNSNQETAGAYETRASAIEYSQPFFSALRLNSSSTDATAESMTASAWYLTEVRDRYGNVLYQFEYERGMFLVQASYMNEDTWESFNGQTYPQSWRNFNCALCLNSPVYLSKILMPLSKEKVEFSIDKQRILSKADFYPSFFYTLDDLRKYAVKQDVSDDIFYFLHGTDPYVANYQNYNPDKRHDPLASMGMSPLKKITVYSNSVYNKILESYELTYSTNTRLFLTEIKISNDHVEKNSYKFTYYEPGLLPKEYIEINTDDWGFYNASNNRSVNTEATQYGMLKEITYPTGGVSVINYAPNYYSDYFDKYHQAMIYEPGITGGLVVSSIVNYENAQKQKVLSSKTYTYGGGQLYALPKHHFDWVSLEGNIILHIDNYNSVVPLCNSFGSHIGYSDVTERNEDGTYTRYEYLNINSCMDERPVISASPKSPTDPNIATPSPFDMYSERGYKRGKISSTTTYDDKGNSISSTFYYYRTDNVEKDFVYNTNLTGKSATTSAYSAQGRYNVGCVYKMYYPKYDVVKTLVYTKYDTGNVSELTEYNKENVTIQAFGQQVSVRKCKSTTINRGNSVLKTEYRYPYHEEGVCKDLISQFYLPAISSNHYLNDILLDGKKTIYGCCNNNYVPLYDIVYANNQNYPDTIARYDSYSKNFRLTQMTDGHGVVHRYFWNDLDKLVATVDNGSTGITASPNATASENILTSSVSEPFGTSPTAATTCIYNERGLIHSITNANRQTHYYEYDTFGRLVSVKDGNNKQISAYAYKYQSSNGTANAISDNAIPVGAVSNSYIVSPKTDAPISMPSGISNFSYNVNAKTVTVDYYVSANAKTASLSLVSETGHNYSSTAAVIGKNTHTVLSLSYLPVGKYDVCLFVDGKKEAYKTIYIPY